ncbi:hypothetical protein [Herpetosiphon geysericola]|uniref:Uncharacterized protein n=1 Tax=Herpetosiphon geysericola TaxID=70996 RepID=A0A0P6YLM2_9CHLR|nr:hypothetical protein [Herpetosiphon geysericola]KPL86155.1 hypothetical protein SE18_14965 [Herpetosiphon geysericola]
MAEAESIIKLVNSNGLLSVIIVLLVFFGKAAMPSITKMLDHIAEYFNPTRADAKAKQQKEDDDREARLRKEELDLLTHAYDGELLDAYKKNAEVNVQVIMTMQAIQTKLLDSDLLTQAQLLRISQGVADNQLGVTDIKTDVARIFTVLQQEQPSRTQTKPNQPLPM